MFTRAAILLALLLLAGCLDNSEAADPLDADADTPSEDGPDDAQWIEDSFSMDGTTSTSACLPNTDGGCAGPIVTSSDSVLVLSSRGDTEIYVTAALTWDDLPIEDDDLSIHLVAYESCGNNCYQLRTLATAHGASPLSLNTDIYKLEANETGFALSIRDAAPLLTSPAHADVKYALAFHLEGIVALR